MVELQSPIITIGAGRSESTLLHRILNTHPDVVFFNENSFLAPRLWLELWQDRFWFTSQMFVARQPRSALDPQPTMEPAVLEQKQEQQRIGALIAQLIADVHRLDRSSCKVWGYKEIWNGSNQFDYPWEDYDKIFPGAFWLHLTRSPFQFARSTAHWNRDPLTLDYLKERARAAYASDVGGDGCSGAVWHVGCRCGLGTMRISAKRSRNVRKRRAFAG